MNWTIDTPCLPALSVSQNAMLDKLIDKDPWSLGSTASGELIASDEPESEYEMQRRERTDVNVAFMQQLGFPTLELTVPARGTRPGTRATGKAPQKKASEGNRVSVRGAHPLLVEALVGKPIVFYARGDGCEGPMATPVLVEYAEGERVQLSVMFEPQVAERCRFGYKPKTVTFRAL